MTTHRTVTLDDAITVIHDAKIADGSHYCGTFKDPRNGCEEWYDAATTLGYLADAGLISFRAPKENS